MKLKLAALFSALLFVSGCQTSPTQTGGAGGTGFGTSGGGAGGSVVSTPQPGSQAALEQAAGDRVFFDFDRSRFTLGSDLTSPYYHHCHY